ncbi:DUF5694 domain-containing protein [Sphingomonas flavalba]|uniref:DUF5694 domain-containing protein n=1 Tax=Sphingomonas flavalba TaxID=2559804 RepID=UPI00109E124B|nr:DUF5694 domain-containing protein [Sphingomonas flavalba]
MRLYSIGVLLAALAASSIAFGQAYKPDFDPGSLKGPRGGAPNQVLVLGTPHLSGLSEPFKADALSSLIGRLARWQPQAIAIEAISGPQCDFMRGYPGRYRETIDGYCWDTAPARAATGLDVAAATAEAERLLVDWPEAPTAAQRRRLAALFLAGGEQASALVQWLRLPESERRAGDGLDGVLVARLNLLRDRRNEDFLIAAPLAAALEQERVYAIDDHTADAPIADEKSYAAAIGKAWDNPATAKRRAMDAALQTKLGSADGVLALYRAYNAPGAAKLAFDSDFGAALEEPSPQRFGRGYVGYWETRNLRMAANIREVMAARPGIRALVIVGGSHKGYLEAYLNQMHDVRLVDAERVLR